MVDRKHILVVEDDVDIAEMLRLLLDMEGYAVSTATTGSDALDRFLAYSTQTMHAALSSYDAAPATLPDLILLDLQLPDMNGEDMIARLYQADLTVPPVIVLTAKRQHVAELTAHQIGAAAVLLKPFEIEILLDHIGMVLTQA